MHNKVMYGPSRLWALFLFGGLAMLLLGVWMTVLCLIGVGQVMLLLCGVGLFVYGVVCLVAEIDRRKEMNDGQDPT